MQSDIEIARGASLKNINEIAQSINIPDTALHNYGRHIAKIDFEYLQNLEPNPNSKLILVTAISPTPAGEGKTTTTIGLGDAINALGNKTLIALREPSLGPVSYTHLDVYKRQPQLCLLHGGGHCGWLAHHGLPNVYDQYQYCLSLIHI